jgi:putative flippase GtrA
MHYLNLIKKFLWENKFSISIFLAIGLTTFIFYFLLFSFLWEVLKINYRVAISIAYISAITFYFFANRRFTFKANHQSAGGQVKRFLILMGLNYLITLSLVHYTVEILHLPPYSGMLLAVITTTISNYFIGKLWVFKPATIKNIHRGNH